MKAGIKSRSGSGWCPPLCWCPPPHQPSRGKNKNDPDDNEDLVMPCMDLMYHNRLKRSCLLWRMWRNFGHHQGTLLIFQILLIYDPIQPHYQVEYQNDQCSLRADSADIQLFYGSQRQYFLLATNMWVQLGCFTYFVWSSSHFHCRRWYKSESVSWNQNGTFQCQKSSLGIGWLDCQSNGWTWIFGLPWESWLKFWGSN